MLRLQNKTNLKKSTFHFNTKPWLFSDIFTSPIVFIDLTFYSYVINYHYCKSTINMVLFKFDILPLYIFYVKNQLGAAYILVHGAAPNLAQRKTGRRIFLNSCFYLTASYLRSFSGTPISFIKLKIQTNKLCGIVENKIKFILFLF